MKTKVYESAVIINAALDDEQIESIISRIKDTIVNNGGEIREIEDWGRKRLAYMVKKSKIGYYAIYRFNAPSTIVAKLERFYQLDEQILRYLTITLDNDALQHLEQNKTNSNNNSEAEKSAKVIEENAVVEDNENDSEDTDK